MHYLSTFLQAFLQDKSVIHNLQVLCSSGKWVPLGMCSKFIEQLFQVNKGLIFLLTEMQYRLHFSVKHLVIFPFTPDSKFLPGSQNIECNPLVTHYSCHFLPLSSSGSLTSSFTLKYVAIVPRYQCSSICTNLRHCTRIMYTVLN